MSRRSRKFRLGNFRSEFEQNVNDFLQKEGFSYETEKFTYEIPRVYTPDFIHDSGVIVECKGFFREGDTQKYRAIIDCLPAFHELVFILMKPNQKVRKGTKLTMAEWCNKYNIKWFSLETIQDLIDYVHGGAWSVDTRGN